MGDSKAHALTKPYKDGRSVDAKRYQEAIGKTKMRMAVDMMRRAVRTGIKADFVTTHSWLGNKEMIRAALLLDMTTIERLKRNKLQYRVKVGRQTKLLDAKQLYQQAVRKQRKKVRGMPLKAVEMIVEVDLALEKGKDKPAENHEVKLLFVLGVNEEEDVDGSRNDWALFLSTDPSITVNTMLETYALRRSIEVYFKEAKQHLEFLKEQSITFVSHTASIHLCAIRYLMLMNGKLHRLDTTAGEIRGSIQDQLDSICFATRLWKIFLAIVGGSLKSLSKLLGCKVSTIMKVIDTQVKQFLVRSLQLEPP